MSITHHLGSATVVAYAAGTLDPAFGIVAASHLALCGECRAAVRAAEAIGGELVAELDQSPVSEACRSRTLAMIETATPHRFPATRPVDSEIPAPLASLLPASTFAGLPWKRKVPGVAVYDVKVPGSSNTRLKLLRIGPGRAMPEHGHGGEEITLILSGAYRDHMGRFGRGDVADLGDDVEHRPVIEDGEACICLIAMQRPTRFKSIAARLLQPFVGI